MAARFCRHCQINWPVGVEDCRKCGGPVQSFAWRNPDASAVALLEERKEEVTELDRVVEWRANCFRDLGVDWDTSIEMAKARSVQGGFEVDLGRFRELVEKKSWPVEHAVAVLR